MKRERITSRRVQRNVVAVAVCFIIGLLLQIAAGLLIAPSLVFATRHAPKYTIGEVVGRESPETAFIVLRSGFLTVPPWDSRFQPLGIPVGLEAPAWLVLGEYLDAIRGPARPTDPVPMAIRSADSENERSANADGAMPVPPPRPLNRRVVEFRVGWPMRSMVGCLVFDEIPPSTPAGALSWGNPRYDWAFRARASKPPFSWTHSIAPEHPMVPFRPALVGSVVNGASFGLVIFACWRVMLMLIAFVRARMGLRPVQPGHCRGCGYDARGLSRCPECGSARIRSERPKADPDRPPE